MDAPKNLKLYKIGKQFGAVWGRHGNKACRGELGTPALFIIHF